MDDYQKKLAKEIENYSNDVNVHDLPPIFHYVTNKHLKHLLQKNVNISSFDEMIIKQINEIKKVKPEHEINILSLGAGNCDFEIDLAKNHNLKCHFTCIEINEDMIERAKINLADLGLSKQFSVISRDINQLKLETESYDIVLANHSLHHFVELEHIFETVHNALTDEGSFVINDMIGRNGHMFWQPTLDLVNRIWSLIPLQLKYNHQLKKYFEKRIQWDCTVDDGFEGIRAQDILPLLDKHFKFKLFAPFFSIMPRFIDRDFGHNFDSANPMHTAILELVWEYDNFCLSNKLLKPTQLMAVVVKRNINVTDYQYTYFENPRDAYELEDANFYNYFDESATGTSDLHIHNDLQNTAMTYGFYQQADDYRFTDGAGVIKIDGFRSSKSFKIYLNFFTTDEVDRHSVNLVLNDSLLANKVTDESPFINQKGYTKCFYFDLDQPCAIEKISLESDSFVPKDKNPKSDDIRRLGFAFIQLKMVSNQSALSLSSSQ